MEIPTLNIYHLQLLIGATAGARFIIPIDFQKQHFWAVDFILRALKALQCNINVM